MSKIIEPKVDIYIDEWITLPSGDNGVRENPPIKIVAGAKDEDTRSSPSKCTMTLDDTDGNYNRRNPMSEYFGLLNKNTPLRVRVPFVDDDVAQTVSNGWGTARKYPSGTYTWVNSPESVGGTVAATNWTRSGTAKTHSVPVASANRQSDLDGTEDYIDGVVRYSITLPTSNITGGSILSWLKLRTVDANNFLAARFEFKTDETVAVTLRERIAGSDRRLMGEKTISGLSVATNQKFSVAVLAEDTVIRIKMWVFGTSEPLDWSYTATRATYQAGYFSVDTDIGAGNSNTKPILIVYDDFEIEAAPFTGEISDFKPGVSDEKGSAPFVRITATSVLHRIEQGTTPFKSATFRKFSSNRFWIREGALLATSGTVSSITGTDADAADIAPVGGFGRWTGPPINVENGTTDAKEDTLFEITAINSAAGSTTVSLQPDALTAIAAGDSLSTYRYPLAGEAPLVYWPCEDGKGATEVASGLVGGKPLIPVVDTPEYATYDVFDGSDPLLKLNNAELFAYIDDYTDTYQAFTVHFLLRMPDDDEAASGTDLVQFYTTGTAENWEIQFATGGSDGDLVIRATDNNGVNLFSTAWGMGVRGTPRMVTLTLKQESPGVVSYDLAAVKFLPNGNTSTNVTTATTATGVSTLGKINRIRVNPLGGYVDVAFGHLAVLPSAYKYFNFIEEPGAHAGESMPRRAIRLAYEENIPLTYCQSNIRIGDRMGSQRTETILSNLQDIPGRDFGWFYESRGAYSLEIKQRANGYLQINPPVIDIDYTGGAVLAELVPSDDVKDVTNDVTIKRIGGGQYRSVLESGPLSIQRNPDGIGTYPATPNVSVGTDAMLPALGDWKRHVGTVDEYRYPSISLTPANGALALERFFSAGIARRVIIREAETSAARTYEPIDQLIQGYELTLHQYVPILQFNGTPASSYNIAILDDPGGSETLPPRYDMEDSVLGEDLDTTETSIDVTNSGVTRWITTALHPSMFPFDVMIGGERITITANTGTGASQTMTGIRSGNRVVKTHLAGAPVRLADKFYRPL